MADIAEIKELASQTQMRNWTYSDKTERNDLSLSCYVRITIESTKNR